MRSVTRHNSHVRSVSAQIRAEEAAGVPLEIGVRRALEHCFDLDLSAIRVHANPVADRLTRGLQADAFAAGPHLFFRESGYQPRTEAGMRLLAHEVAHTIQQSRGAVGAAPLSLSRRGGPWEIEADRAANDALAGQSVHLARGLDAVRPLPVGRPLTIQCHESYEHRALGDVSTDDIYAIAASSANRNEILKRETDLMWLWHQNPDSVTKKQITDISPLIRTTTLAQSGLLVTYGELNALPDYIAQASAIDTCPREVLLPILQSIRQESYQRLNSLRGVKTSEYFAHAPFKPDETPWGLVNKVLATWRLDDVTRNLGTNGIDHYGGLLARNACHFAPYTWYRWQAAYLMARDYATQASRLPKSTERDRLVHLAWTYHGYADHFLQDSFAAGHLINKTLVMQWFVDWAATTYLPIADWDLFKNVTVKNQPNLAGGHLYDPSYQGLSNDPQTVEDQDTRDARLELSGVVSHGSDDKNATYQQYLTFLSSTITQLTTNAIHDHYNENSLWVASEAHPIPYQVYGDDTLFSGKNGGQGARITSETAQLSQQSITELINDGTTQITTQALRDRFPTRAGDDTNVIALQDWIDSKQQWTRDNIFDETSMLFKRMLTTNVSQRVLNFSKDQQFANKWYTSLPDTRYRFTDTVVSNGRLFAGSAGLVFELNPATGEVLRKYQVSDSGQETHVATDGTTLFVGCYGYAYGIRLDDWSKLAWTTGMTGASYCAVQLLCSNGRLFAGSNSTMHEIDVNDGTRKRSKGLSSSVGSDVHLATDGKSIFAGCYGYAYCVPVDNWDKLTWTATMTGSTYTSVRLMYAGGRLFAGSNGAAHEINLATGDRLRSKDLSKLADQDVHLATDGHTLFAGCHAYAYGLNLSDDWSNLAWTTPMSGKLYDSVELLQYDGQLYAGSNGYILNLDASNGAVIKSFILASLAGSGDYTATLALDQKSGLFVGMHGYVYNVTL